MTRVGVVHPGAQHAWQRAAAFQAAGMLGWYATSAYFHPGSPAVRAADHLPGRAGRTARARLLRRHFPLLDHTAVRRMGLAELGELALHNLGADAPARALNAWGNRRFGRQAVELMAREPVDVVWGFDTAALEVFRRAKPRGIACVLDQTIGHRRAWAERLAAEHARHPEVFAGRGPARMGARWLARQDAELALADRVVCGSRFAAETLTARGVDSAKVRVRPYGFDETLWPSEPPRRAPLAGRPLELIFVGTLTPRKGVAHLLRAMTMVPPGEARLTLVGRRAIPARALAPVRERVTHLPHAPPGALPELMRGADLFVLPSLFEGSAVVLNEALAAGLGIVQSAAAGDGAREDVTGTVLDPVSPQRLAATIRALAREPARVARWQANAWAARHTRTWARYRAALPALAAGVAPR